MLKSIVVSFAAVASLVSVVAACGSGDVALGSQEPQHTSGSSCAAAGGTCLSTGDAVCDMAAPSGNQDCNADLLPSGPFCCMFTGDGGVLGIGPLTDGSSGDGSTGDGATGDGGFHDMECNWPAQYDPGSGSADQCTAAKNLLSCAGSNGDGVTCLSNDTSGCPDDGEEPGVTFTCTDQCESGEYGVACGFGPDASPLPPDHCRSMGANPGGTQYYCCPCGV